MRYCRKCVTPHTRPQIHFNDVEICSACVSAEEKRTSIDWNQRRTELDAILDKHRSSSETEYDCIVPVSGGKDSIYQVHCALTEFKLNPLCLTYQSPARTRRGRQNLEALKNMGVDHIDFSPNPNAVRSIARRGFLELGDCSLLDHLVIYSIVPRMALQLNLPLVLWGENPFMEYGGAAEHRQKSTLDHGFMSELDILKGRSALDWIDDTISARDVQSLVHPAPEELNRIEYTPVFLGYYIPWDAQHNVDVAVQYGFKRWEGEPLFGIYDYADLDCMNIVIHHYFKWLKFGFNRITDQASNEIRKGRMSRNEAIRLIRTRDGIKPPVEYIRAFCQQINITEEDFWSTAERFRNLDIWKRNSDGEWYIDGWIGGNKVPDRNPHAALPIQHLPH